MRGCNWILARRKNLYDKHMLSPSSLFPKIIGILSRNGGGKWNQFSVMSAVCRSWTWHLSKIHVGLGTSHFITFASMGLVNLFWPLIFCFPRHHDLRPLDVKYCQFQCCVADMFKRSLPLQFSTSLWLSVGPVSSSYSSISYRWWGKNYGPPSIRSLPVDFNSLSRNLI